MYAYNSRNRGEPPPTRRSQSSREAVPWGHSTFNLPYRVSSSAAPLAKRHFFFSTLKTIQSADGSYASKVGALASRFETGEILLREAHGHLAPMYNDASRTPIWNSTAFQISNPILMNEDGKRVNVPLATDPISVNALPNCAFLRFDLVIDPSTVHGECRESRFTLKSGVAIPDMVRTNGVSPPITDVRELLNVKDLLVAIQGFTGASPIVGNIKPPERGSTWLECLPEGWTARVHEYYLRCIFAILSRRLQESFVGDVPDTTVQQDLTGCKQTIFDAALRRTVNRTITEYYEAFTSIITGSPYDEDKPFPFDIGELFFAGANPNLIAMVHSDKINVTAATPNERVSAALRRLNTIKDVLIAAEGKVQVIDGQIQAVTGNQRPRTNMAMANMVATFPTSPHHQPPFYFNPGVSVHNEQATDPAVFHFHPGKSRLPHSAYPTAQDWPTGTPPLENHGHGAVHMDLAAIFHATASYNPATRTEQEAMLDAAIFLSVAESAIRRATRASAPAECWGCHGIQDLHEHRFHLFKDCPNKTREDVKPNFYRHLQEYKDFMRQRRQSGDMTQSYTPGARPDSGVMVNMVNTTQWQTQGFPSAESADLVTTIASAATTPAARNGCLTALVHSLANPPTKKPQVHWPVPVTHAAAATDHTTEQTLPPEPNKKPRTGIHHKHYMFSLWAQDWGVNAFNLVAREKGLSGGIHNYIAISQNLPHVHLPIGPIAETPDDKGGQLMAMCDTGAGLNLGNLQYHTSCYKIAPRLVESFFTFAEEGFDPITIGGVDGQSQGGLSLTAIITYWLPYEVDGRPATISIGLAEGTATNTILSHPFLRTMQAHIDYEHNTIMLNKIGANLTMFDHVPMKSEAAPSSGDGNPQSFMAQFRTAQLPDKN